MSRSGTDVCNRDLWSTKKEALFSQSMRNFSYYTKKNHHPEVQQVAGKPCASIDDDTNYQTRIIFINYISKQWCSPALCFIFVFSESSHMVECDYNHSSSTPSSFHRADRGEEIKQKGISRYSKVVAMYNIRAQRSRKVLEKLLELEPE